MSRRSIARWRAPDVVGFVFLATGPNAWLLTTERYAVEERRLFDARPGDPWAFVALTRVPGTPAGAR
jgi:hypothetical protein